MSPVTTSHLGGRACRNGHQILCDLPRRDVAERRLRNATSEAFLKKLAAPTPCQSLLSFDRGRVVQAWTGGLFLSSPTLGIRNFVLSVLLQPAKVAQQPMHLGTRYSVFNNYSWPREEQQITVDVALPFAFLRLHRWNGQGVISQKVSQKTSKICSTSACSAKEMTRTICRNQAAHLRFITRTAEFSPVTRDHISALTISSRDLLGRLFDGTLFYP